MTLPDIRALVPHAGPMVLLDRVLAVDEESLTAEVTIRPDSLFCGPDGVGGWVGIEYMAQAIAAHEGHTALLRGAAVKVGFLLGSRRYECLRAVFSVGSILRVHVRQELMADNGVGSYSCRMEDGRGVAATATVAVFLPPDVHEFLNGSQA